ncbi:MAG: hypothetical protein NTV22_11130 [bacterium]|nr:hypothetical protein [bacterium]
MMRILYMAMLLVVCGATQRAGAASEYADSAAFALDGAGGPAVVYADSPAFLISSAAAVWYADSPQFELYGFELVPEPDGLAAFALLLAGFGNRMYRNTK